MNVHRSLQDLVGGLGVRHVGNAEARIEAGGNGEGCAVPVVHQSGGRRKGIENCESRLRAPPRLLIGGVFDLPPFM